MKIHKQEYSQQLIYQMVQTVFITYPE